MTNISFQDSEGNNIVGILENPSDDKTKPIIILCHGFSSDKTSRTYVALERIFNSKEISTLRIDFYGHGESDGKFEDITISRAVDDILSAIKYLKSEGYTKIGLMGASFGGISSSIAASKTDDIYVLALKAPVSDYMAKIIAQKSNIEIDDWKNDGYTYYMSGKHGKMRLNATFLEDSKHNIAYDLAKDIKIPTIIVHGDADDVVPVEQSQKMASLIPNCRLEIIPGADHGFAKEEDWNRTNALITQFMLEHS